MKKPSLKCCGGLEEVCKRKLRKKMKKCKKVTLDTKSHTTLSSS